MAFFQRNNKAWLFFQQSNNKAWLFFQQSNNNKRQMSIKNKLCVLTTKKQRKMIETSISLNVSNFTNLKVVFSHVYWSCSFVISISVSKTTLDTLRGSKINWKCLAKHNFGRIHQKHSAVVCLMWWWLEITIKQIIQANIIRHNWRIHSISKTKKNVLDIIALTVMWVELLHIFCKLNHI